MNVFFGHDRMKSFPELERILIALGIGFLFEFLIFLPPITLANYWYPFLGENGSFWAAALFCAVAACALFYEIYGERRESFIEGAKKILLMLIAPFSIFVVVVLIIGICAIFLYPFYITDLISSSWSSFMALTLLSWGMFLSGAFFLFVYVLKLSLKQSFREKMAPLFKKQAFIGAISISLLVVAASASVVPLDLRFRVFTPSMVTGSETFSPIMSIDKGHFIDMFISATRGPGNNVSAVYQYHALLSTTYNISLPTTRLFSSVYINNPSNASFSIGQYFPSLPDAGEDWKKIYVTAPDNVTYQTILSKTTGLGSKVTGLVFSFGNFSGSSSVSVTLTYWQEIGQSDNVKIEYYNLTFANLGNGTWTETHTILITNGSNDTLIIPAIEYDRFAFDYVIRNSTNVYVNGSLAPYAELISLTRLATRVWVPPGTMSNVTISFQTTRNPE